MTDWLLDLFVPGVPAPQGSKNGFAIAKGRGANRVYTGRVGMVESSKKVAPWRQLVDAACRAEWDGRPVLDEPLVADYEFVFARLKSFRDHKPTPLHTVYPDTSKLVRSTEDAITTAGVWKDDARCVQITATKRRAEPGETPGARIRVARWTPAAAARSADLRAPEPENGPEIASALFDPLGGPNHPCDPPYASEAHNEPGARAGFGSPSVSVGHNGTRCGCSTALADARAELAIVTEALQTERRYRTCGGTPLKPGQRWENAPDLGTPEPSLGTGVAR